MAPITRREGLGMMLGAATLAKAPSALAAATAAVPGLNALAAAKGMRFGSCIGASGGGSFANPRYAALIERECGLLVAENEMKWQAIRPSATSFDFARFDSILAYAARHNLAVRGHTLLWHRPKWMPAWLATHDFGSRPASAAAAMITNHVETVCARYRDRIKSFDVVNETVLPEDGTLAQTALSAAIGGTETLVDTAYHVARATAPGAQLVYNDYMSWEPGNEQHRTGVLKLLEGFRKRGTPVDALGVQSHLIAGRNPQEKAWRAFIDEVTAMNYGLLITEFDVRDYDLPADIAVRDRAIAAETRAYLDLMFAYPRLRDVLVWGLVDPYSWLQGFEPRRDALATRGCLYEAAFTAKPMREAFVAAFAAAPPRA